MLGEKIYHSDKNVKYLFKEGNPSVKKLLVVFSGYASNTSKIKHPYNYMNVLSDVNVHKLFILDDNGATGSYYFGENLNFNVDSSVISLILYFGRSLGISNEDIITLGSSKGGTAALYFGLKYKLGAIFAGAFQTRISDYISSTRSDSSDFLFNKHDVEMHDSQFNQMNQVILNLLNTPVLSNLYLISSKNDWQYKNHIKPFMEQLNDLNIAYDFHLSEEMKNHNEISIYFPIYFRKKIIHELFNIHISKLELDLNEADFQLSVESINLSRNQYYIDYSYEINTNSTVIVPNVRYTPVVPGYYNFYLSIKNKDNELLYKKFIEERFYSLEKLEEPITRLSINEDKLKFEVLTKSDSNLSYAFYIIENGKVKEKIMYQSSNQIEVDIVPNYKYRIQYYIMSDEGYRVVRSSETITS